MSTSMPDSRVKSDALDVDSRRLIAATTSSCFSSRSWVRPFATVNRGEWSDSTRYSWPISFPVIAISSIGLPPSLHSLCVCRSPRSAANSSWPWSANGARLFSRSDRYSGIPPLAACSATAAVFGPIPGSWVSVPLPTRSAMSSSVSFASVPAAVRKALTR